MSHNNVPMTEILPYLYLGNRSDADNVASLIKNGIGFILNLTTSATEYPKDSKIILRHINILDSVSQCLKKTYQEAFDFIDEAQKCNSKVLIHCEAGISRSPTITVAYLIYKRKMEALEAYNFVKKLRPIVSPNFGFMGQLMELEYELVPEKVKLRLEKEACLQKEATKLREERLKEEQAKNEVQKPLVEKVIENSKNKLQLGKKSIKIAIKPTSLNIQIIHKKPNSLPRPLSIDLKSPVLNATANKYILPTNENANLDQPLSNQNLNLNQDLENQNQTNLNISSITNSQVPKTILNSLKCNQTSSSLNSSNSSLNNKQLVNISSSSSKIQNKNCLKQDNQPMPKSTSQPQLINNSINAIHKSQSSIRDSNNNFDVLNVEPIKLKSTSVDSKCNGIDELIAIVNGKSEINLFNNQMDSKEDKSTDKVNDKLTDKLMDKPIDKITNLMKNDTKVSAKSNTTSSLLNSNATTSPSLSKNRHQAITPALCLSELLNPNSKSISQNSIFLINSSKHNSSSNNLASSMNSTVNVKSQMKPLRPSTLLLNSNVPRKIKHNAITPSSLCSPLTAFAVSSTKSSPTFNHLSSNLSSPFGLSEKLVKRRWETEATSYQDLTKDFNPPDCKKKNKQKKLKNITVEVN